MDEHVPHPDIRLARSILVDADPDRTDRAIEHARIDEDPLVRGVKLLRRLPERVLGLFEDTPATPDPGASTLGDLLSSVGCCRLVHEPGRARVYGAVGRFWNPRAPRMGPRDAEGFQRFDTPGHAKGVLAFTLVPFNDERTLLVIEARASGTDADATRRLRTYGRFVEPAARLVADRALALVKQTAETRHRLDRPRRPPELGGEASPSLAVPTIDALDVEDRRVLLRADLDEPVENGQIAGHRRLEAAGETIRALLDRDASVAVLGHQTATGEGATRSLKAHAARLAEITGHDVLHVPHVDDEAAALAVGKLGTEEVLVLANLRDVEGERDDAPADEHAQRPWVRALADAGDAYVNDAFGLCHRSIASIVGFPARIPTAAGPNLLADLEALETATSGPEPRVAVLGGNQLEASLDAVAHLLATDVVARVLLGGLPGLLFLEAAGHDTGEGTRALLEERGGLDWIKQARSLLNNHHERIELPGDVAVRRNGDRFDVPVDELPARGRVMDVGPDTRNRYATRMQEAGTLVVHGPAGVYEDPPFARGTRAILTEAGRCDAYTLVGGQDTVHALDTLGIDAAFDHVSLGNGALLAYLAGEPLPGIQVLEHHLA